MGALVLAHADETAAAVHVAENQVTVETAADGEGALQVHLSSRTQASERRGAESLRLRSDAEPAVAGFEHRLTDAVHGNAGADAEVLRHCRGEDVEADTVGLRRHLADAADLFDDARE